MNATPDLVLSSPITHREYVLQTLADVVGMSVGQFETEGRFKPFLDAIDGRGVVETTVTMGALRVSLYEHSIIIGAQKIGATSNEHVSFLESRKECVHLGVIGLRDLHFERHQRELLIRCACGRIVQRYGFDGICRHQ
jgi:hypothetical protein